MIVMRVTTPPTIGRPVNAPNLHQQAQSERFPEAPIGAEPHQSRGSGILPALVLQIRERGKHHALERLPFECPLRESTQARPRHTRDSLVIAPAPARTSVPPSSTRRARVGRGQWRDTSGV